MSDKKDYKQNESQELDAGIDIFFMLGTFWQGFKKLWWLLLVLAVLGGGAFFVKSMIGYTPVYKCSASFTVSTLTNQKGNSTASYAYYYDQSTASQMAATFPYILESDLLTDLVKRDLGVDTINGTITAEAVADSNLFTLSVTSKNAQDAYDILEAVVNNYQDVSRYVLGETELNMIEEPAVPTVPTNNRNATDSAKKGAAGGIVLALILIFLFSQMRKTIRREDDIKDVLNVECAGSISKVIFKKHRKDISREISIHNRIIGDGFRESIRSMAMRQEKDMQEKGQQVLFITSSMEGEGASTLARNLAYAFAEMDKKVLLVNADFQNIEKLSLEAEDQTLRYGLDDVLRGRCKLSEAMQVDEDGQIFTIQSRKRYKLEEIMSLEEKVEKLFHRFRQTVDYIIIDAPCYTKLGEGMIFAEYSDTLLYVIQQDRASRSNIQEGIEEICGYGVSMSGCILNQVVDNLPGYGYSSKYGKYYGGYSYHKYGYGHRYGHYGRKYGSKYGSKYGYGYHYGDHYGDETEEDEK